MGWCQQSVKEPEQTFKHGTISAALKLKISTCKTKMLEQPKNSAKYCGDPYQMSQKKLTPHIFRKTQTLYTWEHPKPRPAPCRKKRMVSVTLRFLHNGFVRCILSNLRFTDRWCVLKQCKPCRGTLDIRTAHGALLQNNLWRKLCCGKIDCNSGTTTIPTTIPTTTKITTMNTRRTNKNKAAAKTTTRTKKKQQIQQQNSTKN